MVNFKRQGSSPRNFTAPLCLLFLLQAAGCFTQQAVPAAVLGELRAAVAREPATRVLLRGENGAKVRVAPRSRVRFLRADGSYSPWLRAHDLWLSAEGVLVRHRYPLEALRELRITGLDPDGVDLLLHAKPAGALALDLGQGIVALKAEPGPLAAWVRDFVVALAQQRAPHIFHDEGRGFALLSPPSPGRRYARVIRDLRRHSDGAFLGSWGLAVRTEEWHWVRGHELLRALDEGLELLDGLRFADLRTLEVERFDVGKTAANVALTAAYIVVSGVAQAMIIAPFRGGGGASNFGSGLSGGFGLGNRGSGVSGGGGDPGSLDAVTSGGGDPGPDAPSIGNTLWIAPLPTPTPSGARPLFAPKQRPPAS